MYVRENPHLSFTHAPAVRIQVVERCQPYCSSLIQKLRPANFFAETEHVSLSHLQLAQSIREEAKKVEEFREKQRDLRKKVASWLPTLRSPPIQSDTLGRSLGAILSFQIEQQMDAHNKRKCAQFKKTLEVSTGENNDKGTKMVPPVQVRDVGDVQLRVPTMFRKPVL